jgi:hypothetical protein
MPKTKKKTAKKPARKAKGKPVRKAKKPAKKAVKKTVKKAAKKSVKKAVKKTAKKTKKAVAPKLVVQKPVGAVTHFYNHIGVAIVQFTQPTPVGVVLHYKGATTDFMEKAASMQFDHQPIPVAPKGKQVGIKVKKPVREGDSVYLA